MPYSTDTSSPILVEFVGPAGVGKSSVITCCCAEFRASGMQARSIVSIDKRYTAKYPSARIVQWSRKVFFIMSGLRLSFVLGTNRRRPPSRLEMRWAGTIFSNSRAIRRLGSSPDFILLEHGSFRGLIGATQALSLGWTAGLLPVSKLPDVVVVLRADPAIIAQRAYDRGGKWQVMPKREREAYAVSYYETVHALLNRMNLRVLYQDNESTDPMTAASAIVSRLREIHGELAERKAVEVSTGGSDSNCQ